VVLAAAAATTTAIGLTSATTLLGVADPVRVYEDFATVELISRGRAEIIAGRSPPVDGRVPGGEPGGV
jgi:alkanesulfonate monooxygenase SsuD/methylene tetrahydromethanopterin reductase-like flavin-dependent oxidoreductase (luciferase family)